MRDLIWAARYRDGSELKEFEFHGTTWRENSFYRIKRPLVTWFGLIGSGQQIGFDCTTGIFEVNGRRLFVRLATHPAFGGLTYDFMNQRGVPYNDLIQFKEAFSDYSPKTGQEVRKGIIAYNVGWKQSFSDPAHRRDFWVKPIVRVPSNPAEPMTLSFRMVCSSRIAGKLQVVYGDKMREFPGEARPQTAVEIKVEV